MTEQLGYNGQNAAALVTPSRSRHAVGGRATLPTHKPIPQFEEFQKSAFWERVEIDMVDTDACFPWKGGRTAKGYGKFRAFRAHRVAYTLARGPIPDGLDLDHLCRNRLCCNPAHLEAVPAKVNILRGEGACARKARQTHCQHGHEFTPANILRKRNGGRECKQCRKDVRAARKQWRSGKRRGIPLR